MSSMLVNQQYTGNKISQVRTHKTGLCVDLLVEMGPWALRSPVFAWEWWFPVHQLSGLKLCRTELPQVLRADCR